MDCGVDVRFPHAFAFGQQLSQLGIAMLLSHSDRSSSMLTAAAAVSGASVAWALGFGWLPGASDGVSLVPSVQPLRAASNSLVLITVLVILLDVLPESSSPSPSQHSVVFLGVAWVVVAAVAALGVMWSTKRAQAAQDRALKATALSDCCSLIEGVGGQLCLADAVDGKFATEAMRRQGGWSAELRRARTAQELGRLLAAFEDKVLAERLRPSFVLKRRLDWRGECVATGLTFEAVGSLALELHEALMMPPFVATSTSIVRKVLKEKRSARYAERTILSFLLGDAQPPAFAEALKEALQPRPPPPPSSAINITGHVLFAGVKLNEYAKAVAIHGPREEEEKAHAAAKKQDGEGCSVS